ncbi:Deoxycytidine monophosphate (dCMP) deaminase [Phlyctochytrium planicorne]|nr:Deoxycytidine monophosphate (dCMP) deaminase [Phlyctochytrium planicorne]
MLVAVAGSTCSGKETLISFLCSQRSFKRIIVLGTDVNTDHGIDEKALVFDTPQAALRHATNHWMEDFAMRLPVESELFRLDEFRHRPFFLLMSVEAPALVRFERWIRKTGLSESGEEGRLMMLERFMRLDEGSIDGDASGMVDGLEELRLSEDVDAILLSPPSTPAFVSPRSAPSKILRKRQNPSLLTQQASTQSDIRILNHTLSLQIFHQHLTENLHHLLHPSRLRPDWDTYFMRLCNLAASRSNCMKRRVGCILAKDRRVLATGYNGTPRGVRNCNEGGCGRCNGNVGRGVGLDECLCLHAEENALLEAGRERIAQGETILYCNTCPCIGCAKKIVQAGVKKVVYALEYSMDDVTRRLFDEAGIEFVQHHELERVVVIGD